MQICVHCITSDSYVTFLARHVDNKNNKSECFARRIKESSIASVGLDQPFPYSHLLVPFNLYEIPPVKDAHGIIAGAVE